MQNACRPCLYKLENEPPLRFSLMTTLDGNQSLRLVDDSVRSGTSLKDERGYRTDICLTPEEVDVFKDEVKNMKGKGKSKTHADDDRVWLNSTELHEVEEGQVPCTERWKAAGPEACKKMFAIFAISGIFVCLCRHGHLLIMCDMIRSGEL